MFGLSIGLVEGGLAGLETAVGFELGAGSGVSVSPAHPAAAPRISIVQVDLQSAFISVISRFEI
jgi:hypothetical protein